MDWLDGLDAYWVWLTLGLVLAGLEMLVPGVYLIWLAIAAFVTGALTMVFDLSVPVQVIDFVFFSLIAAFSARRFLGERGIPSVDPLMNRRGARLVGEIATVTEEIGEGTSGRVHYGDSDWLARGAVAAVGAKVRITGSEGAVLLVEPAKLISGGGEADSGPAES
jgi:membrane protein implicated in regulation of membrane protease activity